jgi:hypothetical protein
MQEKHYFTASEIDVLIPQLTTIFEHIETCKTRAEALALESITSPAETQPRDVVNMQVVQSQVEFLMEAVQEDIQHIQKLGGIAKDLEVGLVDFLGEVDGQEVWLCWKRGETHVRYWHALDSGFAQRRALPHPESPTTIH